MKFFQIISLILAATILQTAAFPSLDVSGLKNVDAKVESYSNENILTINEKRITKRQVVPGPTGPGQYGGTWNSNNGKTQVKAGVDFNNAPKLGWHADASHQIHKSQNGKVSTEIFGGARQPFNQVGRSNPDVHAGIRVHFR